MQERITSPRTYITVGATLLGLLVLTVGAALIDLGPWNSVVAVTIAILKALLVILFFMHARFSSRAIWIYVLAGFFWLLLFFSITLADYITRSWLPGK